MTLQTSVASPEPYVPRRATSEIARKLVLYALMLGVAAVFFVPFVWTIATSLKTQPDSISVSLIPHPWTISAWHNVWANYDFPTYIKNTFFLAGVIVPCSLFLSALGGYAFARLRFPGRELLFFLVLGTLMVPDQLRLLPIFVMIVHWGLFDSFWGYIMINLVSATNLFFMRQYFLTIPRDFEEAAKLDGAGHFKTYWRVMLPLALPAMAALAILQFQGTWNDFFWPLILFGQGNADHYTIQLGLAQLHSLYLSLWPEITAGSIIAIVPVVVVFLAFQRYFVSGVVSAGVKG
jgi:ABC-type glycerol-3-phosphate transport system permease component